VVVELRRVGRRRGEASPRVALVAAEETTGVRATWAGRGTEVAAARGWLWGASCLPWLPGRESDGRAGSVIKKRAQLVDSRPLFP
jgi:hypothetical protein